MNFYKVAVFWIAMAFANTTLGSQFLFLFRDFALPNKTSDYQPLGSCNLTNSYVGDPVANCEYGIAPTGSETLRNDKEIVVDFSNLLSSDQDLVAFDRYITFKEAGPNPAQWDDYLRVEFDPTGVLVVSLVSNPSAGLPLGSVNVGNFVNDTNETIDVTRIFSFPSFGLESPSYEGRDITSRGIDFGDPLIKFNSSAAANLPVGLAVQPTYFVDEPGSLALMLAAIFPFLLLRKGRRLHESGKSSSTEI